MVKIDGNEFPEDLYYHRDHMWVKIEEGKARVGYNDWAQEAAGKLVNLSTRKVGRSVKAGKTLGTVESGKWVGPLKTPLSGEIVELNEEVLKTPSIINDDPYGRGWIALLAPSDLDAEMGELIKGADKDILEAWLSEEKAKHAT
ncbi:MAG: glycine cleavage system protein GcvH [Candidatus Bathyarchaeota archaeon]|nr:MAG: glycine cleavage system protein GcvH [Candidatus Bathyarchaeota archaeon]